MSGRSARVLLIGNSRWHWAERLDPATGPPTLFDASRTLAQPVPVATGAGAAGEAFPAPWCCGDAPPAASGAWDGGEILAWAAVGSVPEGWDTVLPAQRRLFTPQVPLEGTPPWLGVDRALVGWQAWCRQQQLLAAPVLVADAGTVLSLTLVGQQGHFLGGRLLAGAALQWRAMAAGTALLPDPQAAAGAPAGAPRTGGWPVGTAEAMRVGVLEGLAAAVLQAHRQLVRGEGCSASASDERTAGHCPDWEGMDRLQLWITGGDGPQLAPLVRDAGVAVVEAPDLAMEALISLAPLS